MRPYHKIHSVFLRDPATKHKNFLMGQYTFPEFEYLANSKWLLTEKVDGTNIRVHFELGIFTNSIKFGGRTDNAQIPASLYEKLAATFTLDKMEHLFPDASAVTLYGEGYGAKIQGCGGSYIPDGVDFILFDVMINGMWLMRDSVKEIAQKLGVRSVPEVGVLNLTQAIEFVKAGFESRVAARPGFFAEGVIATPLVPLLSRNGSRLITKIKHRDFFNLP